MGVYKVRLLMLASRLTTVLFPSSKSSGLGLGKRECIHGNNTSERGLQLLRREVPIRQNGQEEGLRWSQEKVHLWMQEAFTNRVVATGKAYRPD